MVGAVAFAAMLCALAAKLPAGICPLCAFAVALVIRLMAAVLNDEPFLLMVLLLDGYARIGKENFRSQRNRHGRTGFVRTHRLQVASDNGAYSELTVFERKKAATPCRARPFLFKLLAANRSERTSAL